MNDESVSNQFYTTAGYYSHAEGARYFNPLAIGTNFPHLVELHETIHKELALSNIVDGVGRLYTTVYTKGDEELSEHHHNKVQGLLKIIHSNTINVHETVATYLGLVMFHIIDPDNYSKARRQLPPFYRKALINGEQSFGQIDDNRFSSSFATIIFHCAIASMNIDLSESVIKLGNLDECAQYISKNSPDKRFKKILKKIEPHWIDNSIFSQLDFENKDKTKLQAEVFRVLRKEIPNLKFFSHYENPTLFRDMAEILKEDALKQGYSFLKSQKVVVHAENTLKEVLGARFTQPDLDGWEPLDLSLKQNQYATGDLEDLVRIAEKCIELDTCVFCHFFIDSNEITNIGLACLPVNIDSESAPITLMCSFDELVDCIEVLLKDSLVFKIDERLLGNHAQILSNLGYAVFTLLHDTRPKNIVDSIIGKLDDQNVCMAILPLSEDLFVMAAYLSKDKYTLLAPITKVGLGVINIELGELKKVKTYSSDDRLFNDLRIEGNLLIELILSTYVGNSGDQK